MAINNISIILPVYNEEDVIKKFSSKITGNTLNDLLKYEGLAAQSGYDEKISKYSTNFVFEEGRLIPISIDTYGFLHDKPYKFLRKYVTNRAHFRTVIETLAYGHKLSACKSILRYLELFETTRLSSSTTRRRAAATI